MKNAEKMQRLKDIIGEFYGQKGVSSDLREAILYSVYAGGKRIRPLVFLELIEGFGVSLQDSHFQLAAAIEMIHTGSLIHDDLPSMDNDDYRRGQLTNHKRFGEARAILAGDSLFLDSYTLIAQSTFSAVVKVQLIDALSQASGTFGMIGGQVLDMEGEDKELSLSELERIHVNKTGKLLTFPFIAASIVIGLDLKRQFILKCIGEHFGFAFQIRDDILDVTASFEELGKTPNKDVKARKLTYPGLLGLEDSHELLKKTLEKVKQGFIELEREVVFHSESIVHLVEGLKLRG